MPNIARHLHSRGLVTCFTLIKVYLMKYVLAHCGFRLLPKCNEIRVHVTKQHWVDNLDERLPKQGLNEALTGFRKVLNSRL